MKRLLAAVAACLLLPAAAHATTIPVAPGGDLSAAYNQAQAGDVIELSTGNYGAWTTPAGTKQITVQAAAGEHPVIRQLLNQAANITFDGIDVDAGGYAPDRYAAAFETGGNPNVTFKNGRIGNIIDQKGAVAGGTTNSLDLGTVFDNVVFHDVNPVDPATHSECIFSQAPGLVVRNSTFEGVCGSTGAIFILRGDWWGQPPYGGWTFENNTFARQLFDHGSIIFANACPNDVCDNAQFRGNTFDPASMPNTTAFQTFTNSHESCNTPQVNLDGIIHDACGSPPPPPADADGDGVPDSQDQCPNDPGPASNNGCPVPQDTTPPATSITSAPTDSTSTSASVSFTADEPATFECALDGAAFAGCSSPKAYSGLAVGSHTVQVRATDTAGNVGAPVSATWDVLAPAVTFVGRKTVGTSVTDWSGSGELDVWQVASAAITVTKICGLTQAANSAVSSVDLAIYTDQNNAPKTRLATARFTGTPASSTAFCVTIPATALPASGNVWIGWVPHGNRLNFAGVAGRYVSQTSVSTPPSVWPSGGGSGSVDVAVWAE